MSNITTEGNETWYCPEYVAAFKLKESVRIVNICFTIIIILVGLVGNSLGVFVFIQRRFRHHSSSIYLLFLCLCDGLFLLVHFFEDTLRTYIDVYLNKSDFDKTCLHTNSTEIQSIVDQLYRPESISSPIRLINITDRFNITCQIVNFFRNFLRFVSAFLILAFTIQRTFAIRFPLHGQTIESNKIAWLTVSILITIGIIINMWVPFFFETFEQNATTKVRYCDTKERAYFYLTIVFIFLIILIPILVIFACNSFIVFYLIKANRKRAHLSNMQIMSQRPSKKLSEDECIKNLKVNKYSYSSSSDRSPAKQSLLSKGGNSTTEYQFSLRHVDKNGAHKPSTKRMTNESNKITRMLVLMSFSYAILNLPYFIAWCVFFYRNVNKSINKVDTYYYHSYLQICEIFYILNYACHFYLYCAAGSSFRLLLKKALGRA